MKENDFVRATKKPEWGIGKILNYLDGTKVRVFFEDAGEKIMMLDFLEPENNPRPGLALCSATKMTSFKGFKTLGLLVDNFLRQYPAGFNDPLFIKSEREYKEKTSKILVGKLNQQAFSTLLAEEKYDEIADNALFLVRKTNLIFPNEAMSLTDALKKTTTHQESFAQSLYNLLYSQKENGEHFDDFCGVLSTMKACKWTIATYFPFLQDPQKEIFVKPQVTQETAKAFAYSLKYDTIPCWDLYLCIRTFAQYVSEELKAKTPLFPQDNIDIQSFFWCAHQ